MSENLNQHIYRIIYLLLWKAQSVSLFTLQILNVFTQTVSGIFSQGSQKPTLEPQLPSPGLQKIPAVKDLYPTPKAHV